MVARIYEHLKEAGLKGKKPKELTGSIAFEIAGMVDDTAGLEFDGIQSNPYLAFVSDKNHDEIIHLGGNSYCHEMVYGILNAMHPD